MLVVVWIPYVSSQFIRNFPLPIPFYSSSSLWRTRIDDWNATLNSYDQVEVMYAVLTGVTLGTTNPVPVTGSV